MEPLDVFRAYCGVKAHFTSPRYDFIDQKGAVKANAASLERRADRYFFQKLSRNLHGSQVVPFFVANFIEDPNKWVGDLADRESESRAVYFDWYRRITQLSRQVEYDVMNMRRLAEDRAIQFTDFFQSDDGYPPVFQFLQRRMICPETFIYLDMRFHVVVNNDPSHSGDPIWDSRTFIMHKYGRFLRHVRWSSFDHLIPENLASNG